MRRIESFEQETKESVSDRRSVSEYKTWDEESSLDPSKKYEANGYHYETDRNGRVCHVDGFLRLDKNTDRNQKAQLEAGGEDRRSTDNGGHYIGNRFGGSGDAVNLFAQDENFNKSAYKKMENVWEKKLMEKDEKGNPRYQVEVDIRPKYTTDANGTQRPSSLYVYEKISDTDGNVTKNIYHFKNEANQVPYTRSMGQEQRRG